MLKKTIIAGAAAIMVGAGATALASTPASAGYYNGGGVWFGWSTPRYTPHPPPRFYPRSPPRKYRIPAKRQVCTPRLRTVRAWKPRRGWVTYRVYAGKVCRWQPTYRRW